ncbi:MAG TPA: tripartite tricarboxylate transporter substrate binding protein [Burkholderiales bacterium]|nr:tripartite tricarboxylate transporter substrate binding protein [Burkholderiales bacterium]
MLLYRLLLVALAMANVYPALAETWPTRPIRFIVPFAPGGGGDVVGRIIGQRMSEQFGKPLVIDNRAGGGGTLGCELAAKAAPDGYTLLLGNVGPIAVGPALYPKLAYDPVRDFAPVTMIASFPNLLVANPGLPFKTVPELVAYAKSRPGALNFASAGAGTSTHLAGELFKSVAGIDVVHVPYKGGAAAMTDIIAGQVAYYFGTMPSSMPLAKAGKLRALAVTSLTRSPAAPEVPTIAESGYPKFETAAWYGLMFPTGTPREIVARTNAATMVVLALPDIRERLVHEGSEPLGSTPAQFGAYIKAEIAKWSAVVKAANLRAD